MGRARAYAFAREGLRRLRLANLWICLGWVSIALAFVFAALFLVTWDSRFLWSTLVMVPIIAWSASEAEKHIVYAAMLEVSARRALFLEDEGGDDERRG